MPAHQFGIVCDFCKPRGHRCSMQAPSTRGPTPARADCRCRRDGAGRVSNATRGRR